jgi:type IV pilus assembly protein PilB
MDTIAHLYMARSETAPPPLLKIGELLVKEGFATEEDIERALDIQKSEKEEQKLPLGMVLVKRGLLTSEQLRSLLEHPDLHENIGVMAIDRGLLTQDQLASCIKDKQDGEHIGKALMTAGYISPADLDDILKKQMSSTTIARLAVKQGMIAENDLKNIIINKRKQRTIGEILCDLNLITPLDLNYVLQKYSKQLKLGEILVKQNLIDEKQLNAALKEQRHSSEPLGKVLLKLEFVSQDQLYAALSRQYNIPYKKMEGFVYNDHQTKDLTRIVGVKYAEKNYILPLSIEKNHLVLGVSNPEKFQIIQELRSVYSHLQMSCLLITDDKFQELFSQLYQREYSREKQPEAKKDHTPAANAMTMKLEADTSAKSQDSEPQVFADMETEELVNYIIKYGIRHGASDIHLEQDRKGARLRYRIDGVLQTLQLERLENKLQEAIGAVISRIKVMSNLDISERRIPQDGVFRINYFDKDQQEKFELDFRVATCPAIVGESITIRILDSRKAMRGIDHLYLSDHVLTSLKRLLKSPAGMVLVSGPTGSGKSSTLYGALQYIYHPGIKIITAEDPIEYSFPGIMQTQVNAKIDLSFARLLRSFLRLDPDVILVGEMRDEETANIGFDAAQTGHLLLSTIHTNDAIGAVTRLRDLNVEYGQMASSLMGVLAQRLVRKICPACQRAYQPDEEEWSQLFPKEPTNLTFFEGDGCVECGYTGYKGRIVIAELLVIDADIAMGLNKKYAENEIRCMAQQKGMRTMIDDGLQKLDQTTLSEILRVLPREMVKEYRSRQVQTGNGDPGRPGMEGSQNTDQEVFSRQISRIDQQELDLDRMHQAYNRFKATIEPSYQGSESDMFKQFIRDSYQDLCQRYQCQTVQFTIELKEWQVDISAKPVRSHEHHVETFVGE